MSTGKYKGKIGGYMLGMSPEIAVVVGLFCLIVGVVAYKRPPKSPGFYYLMTVGATIAFGIVSTLFGALALIMR